MQKYSSWNLTLYPVILSISTDTIRLNVHFAVVVRTPENNNTYLVGGLLLELWSEASTLLSFWISKTDCNQICDLAISHLDFIQMDDILKYK